jgi:hypothetical protein
LLTVFPRKVVQDRPALFLYKIGLQSWFIADLFPCFPKMGRGSTGDKQTSKGLFICETPKHVALERFKLQSSFLSRLAKLRDEKSFIRTNAMPFLRPGSFML